MDGDDEVVPYTTVTLNCVDLSEIHTFTLRLRNINSLKSYIANTFDIPRPRQIIVHQGTLVMNEDKEFTDVRDASGRAEMEVYTKIQPEDVDVQVETPTGHERTFEIHSLKTIADLKKVIDKWEGISPRRQVLTVMGVEMDYDARLVEDYVTILPLEISLTEIPPDPDNFVRVNLINERNGSRATVEVEGYDSIYTLHGLARRHGVAIGYNFYFIWNCHGGEYEYTRLEGHSSLYSCGIENGNDLYVSFDSDSP